MPLTMRAMARIWRAIPTRATNRTRMPTMTRMAITPPPLMVTTITLTRAELEEKYPEAKFLGARFGEELARCFRDADVFVFPSWTDTFGLVILEAMATGTPVAAYPAHGPIDIIPNSGAGAIDKDLRVACLEALKCDRADVRAYAEKFSWRASAEQFVENLQPYPEPERGRFWRRLRRIARLRKKAAA